VMRFMGVGVDDEGNPLPFNLRREKYRLELMGSRVLETVPYLYNDTMTALDSGAIAVWDSLSVRIKARVKAALQIKNMAQIVERHRDKQAQAAEKSKTSGKL